MLQRNKKTGDLYYVTGTAIDATNERDGIKVIMYHKYGEPNKTFVRELTEFQTKFDIVTPNRHFDL